MINIENWGVVLKDLIRANGYEQQEVAKKIGISAQLLSLRLKDPDIKIKTVLSILDCIGSDIVSVLYSPDEIKNYLPKYITQDDAEMCRIINYDIDIEKRITIKRVFADLLNALR